MYSNAAWTWIRPLRVSMSIDELGPDVYGTLYHIHILRNPNSEPFCIQSWVGKILLSIMVAFVGIWSTTDPLTLAKAAPNSALPASHCKHEFKNSKEIYHLYIYIYHISMRYSHVWAPTLCARRPIGEHYLRTPCERHTGLGAGVLAHSQRFHVRVQRMPRPRQRHYHGEPPDMYLCAYGSKLVYDFLSAFYFLPISSALANRFSTDRSTVVSVVWEEFYGFYVNEMLHLLLCPPHPNNDVMLPGKKMNLELKGPFFGGAGVH